jgi:aspartate--ammonia ligase
MTSKLYIPTSYQPLLDVHETEVAIKRIKQFFAENLAERLGLTRVTAPLFVRSGTGVNDDLNGVEQPVRFCVKGDDDAAAEIVQSLAKWKRLALARHGFEPGQGLYADMNAVRPDETLDNTHSIYVDQWDWEKAITAEERTEETLADAVRGIYDVMCRTEFHVASLYSGVRPSLPEHIEFISAEQLQQRYPDCTPVEREDRVCKEHGAVFVMGIGSELADGRPHDRRAPDYDDWITPRVGGRGLNGDILVWNPVLKRAFELSSMGIRVTADVLREQLKRQQAEDRLQLPFHRKLLAGELPQCMGGGIGQSRLCMFYLRAAHIGEVSVGLWPRSMEDACAGANIFLR